MRVLHEVALALMLVVGLAASGCGGAPEEANVFAGEEKADRIDCSYVKCAVPICADGQQVRTQGGCCPVCVGAPSRCATVLCAAVACAADQILVTSPGQCCGHCVKAPPVKECTTDLDCPQVACITCPCPVPSCQGGRCITTTPSASTCGGSF